MTAKHNFPQNKAWGTRFDTLRSVPASPPSPPLGDSTKPVHHQQPTTPAKNNLFDSNSSSIFVGSLPPNAEPIEISHRLAAHLKDYIDIQRIKVVRDYRGGACAFVQCKDAAAAQQFIQNIRAYPPAPFMGRALRFEEARSSRTLLLSYRAPVRVLDDAKNVESVDPAIAMRIFRVPGERYVTFLYNAEAVHYEVPAEHVVTPTSPFDNGGLLFAPLCYDGKTLHQIVSAFGPLEHFISCQPDTSDGAYPAPHSTLRSANMDNTCWEAKWEQREDSMAALMALRNVPHISVSWAHLAGQRPGDHFSSPFTPSIQTHPTLGTPSTWISPLRYHNESGHHSPHSLHQKMASPSAVAGSDGEIDCTTGIHPLMSRDDGNNESGALDNAREETSVAGTPVAQVRPTATTPHSAVSALANGSPVRVTTSLPEFDAVHGQRKVLWHEDDFPPLSAHPSTGSLNSALTLTNLNDLRGNEVAPVLTLDTAMQAATQGRVSLAEAFRALTISRETSAEDSTAILTPDSPNVQLVTPDTPYELHALEMKGGVDISERTFDNEAVPRYAKRTDRRQLDFSTIFVGGLEMHGPNAWTEERIEHVFGHYGKIEDIKFIRPSGKKAAFAFVRYLNDESSLHAVKAEHNRVYDDRRVRVQIREKTSQRPFFRFAPTRTTAVTSLPRRPQEQRHGQQTWTREQHQHHANESIHFQPQLMHPMPHIRQSESATSTSPPRSVTSAYPPSTVTATPEPFIVHPQAHHSMMVASASHLYMQQQYQSHMAAVQQQRGGQPGIGYFAPPQFMMAPQFAYPMSLAPYPAHPNAPPSGHINEGNQIAQSIHPGAQPQPAIYPYPYPMSAPAMVPPSDNEQHRRGPMPPLVPTSFVHGEHGFVPVYSPEELDRQMYMMHSHNAGPPSTQMHERPPLHGASGQNELMSGGPAPGHAHGYPARGPPIFLGFPHAATGPVPIYTPSPSQGQPPAPINVNTLFTSHAPPSTPRSLLAKPAAETPTAGASVGPRADNDKSKSLTPQTREFYGDVRVPVIGVGPPPVPQPRRRPVRQQHRKSAASLEARQPTPPAPEAGSNVIESRSSPLMSRAMAAQGDE